MITFSVRCFLLARRARRRALTWLAAALAVLLVASGMFSAVMPVRALSMMTAAVETVLPHVHRHGGVVEIPVAPHADGCPCCSDDGCVCLHGAGALPAVSASVAAIAAHVEVPQIAANDSPSAPRAPPLRPPIA